MIFITDRTFQDCVDALEIRREKIQNFIQLTEEEEVTVQRGLVGLSALQRIESNITALKETLDTMGYRGAVGGKTWLSSNYYFLEDFDDLINRVNRLKNSFFVRQDAPVIDSFSVDFETFNKIESILKYVKDLCDEVDYWTLECGTFECGEFL